MKDIPLESLEHLLSQAKTEEEKQNILKQKEVLEKEILPVLPNSNTISKLLQKITKPEDLGPQVQKITQNSQKLKDLAGNIAQAQKIINKSPDSLTPEDAHKLESLVKKIPAQTGKTWFNFSVAQATEFIKKFPKVGNNEMEKRAKELQEEARLIQAKQDKLTKEAELIKAEERARMKAELQAMQLSYNKKKKELENDIAKKESNKGFTRVLNTDTIVEQPVKESRTINTQEKKDGAKGEDIDLKEQIKQELKRMDAEKKRVQDAIKEEAEMKQEEARKKQGEGVETIKKKATDISKKHIETGKNIDAKVASKGKDVEENKKKITDKLKREAHLTKEMLKSGVYKDEANIHKESLKEGMAGLKAQLDMVALEEESSEEYIRKEHEKAQKAKDNIRNKVIQKNVALATTNINGMIDSLSQQIKEERKKEVVDEEKIRQLSIKQNSYKNLKDKLLDKDIPFIEKEGLLSMLGNGDWLKSYIKHRSENVGMNQQYVEKELKSHAHTDYSKMEDNFYSNLFEKSIEEQKFALVEEFAKLKNGIPGLEHINFQDNIPVALAKLKISDPALLEKAEQLLKVQENIKHFSMDTYTDSFLGRVYDKKRSIESQIKYLHDDKQAQLQAIAQMDISDEEKEQRKTQYLDIYDKKAQEVFGNKEKIDSEIKSIESVAIQKGTFKAEELDQLGKNLKLFSVVSNYDEYGDLISGISDDIVEGKTDFVSFKTMKHLEGDIYTHEKVRSIVSQQVETIDGLIDLLKDSTSNEDRRERNELIREKQRYLAQLDKIERNDINESDVRQILSLDNLHKASYYLDKLEYLQKKKNGEVSEEDTKNFESLSKDYKTFLATKKARIKELKSLYKKTKSEGEAKAIQEEIAILEGEIKDGRKKFFEKFDISEEIINEELADGYNLFDKRDYNQKGKEFVKNLKGAKKLIENELLYGKDILDETSSERKIRHFNMEKNLNGLFGGSISVTLHLFFTTLNYITDSISTFGEKVGKLRNLLEANKMQIFIGVLVGVLIITIFSSKNSFNFIDINTHLFSFGDYTTDSNGVIEFSEKTDDGSLPAMGAFYYKANVFLLFMYFIVLYQIIIEFLYKYLETLKNPTLGLDAFVRRALKLVIFFFMLGLIFKMQNIFY